jgi:hypothetical protein
MEVGKMRLSELVPGENSLEDIRIWGIYHIENLVKVMEEVLESSPLVAEALDPVKKSRLIWVCYAMKDYVDEVNKIFDPYIIYVDDLEEKLKALTLEWQQKRKR